MVKNEYMYFISTRAAYYSRVNSIPYLVNNGWFTYSACKPTIIDQIRNNIDSAALSIYTSIPNLGSPCPSDTFHFGAEYMYFISFIGHHSLIKSIALLHSSKFPYSPYK